MTSETNPASAGEREREAVARVQAIADEAKRANAVIALNRDGDGQGRIKVATAMHRIERLANEALALPPATQVGEAPAEEIGRLANRILELAPSAGLYVGINIEAAKGVQS